MWIYILNSTNILNSIFSVSRCSRAWTEQPGAVISTLTYSNDSFSLNTVPPLLNIHWLKIHSGLFLLLTPFSMLGCGPQMRSKPLTTCLKKSDLMSRVLFVSVRLYLSMISCHNVCVKTMLVMRGSASVELGPFKHIREGGKTACLQHLWALENFGSSVTLPDGLHLFWELSYGWNRVLLTLIFNQIPREKSKLKFYGLFWGFFFF